MFCLVDKVVPSLESGGKSNRKENKTHRGEMHLIETTGKVIKNQALTIRLLKVSDFCFPSSLTSKPPPKYGDSLENQ
jgi:hypothetical protein